jgi:hypothetical protein
VLNFLASESNHFNALLLKPFGPNSVFFYPFRSEVRMPIAFDTQFGFGAIEVKDVNPFDVLPSELGVATLSVSNELPYQILGGRHCLSEVLREVLWFQPFHCHALTSSSPNPFSSRGGEGELE